MTTKAQLTQYCADHFPQITHTVTTGITYMDIFIATGIATVVGLGLGYLVGKIGIAGIKADIAAIKAKIEPTPTPVAVVAPVVTTPAV